MDNGKWEGVIGTDIDNVDIRILRSEKLIILLKKDLQENE
jgi:hypothetical protein